MELFFEQSLQQKNLVKLEHKFPYLGYVGKNSEENVILQAKENYERIILLTSADSVNPWPNLPKFKIIIQQYMKLMVGIGQALYKSMLKNIFPEIRNEQIGFDVERSISRLAINHYKFSEDTLENESIGINAHRDNTLFNIFDKSTPDPRTQFLSKDGNWYYLPLIPGTVMANVGVMLETISNGIYYPPLHKAMCPETPGNKYTLLSAMRPNPNAIVEPLMQSHSRVNYTPMTALESVNNYYSKMYP